MDIFLGLSMGVVIAIVTLTETIKKIDSNNKLKKFYVYIPLLMGIFSAYLLTDPFVWKEFILNAMLYAGGSSYGYTFFKKTIDNVVKKDE
jgi:predicted small secreted protein